MSEEKEVKTEETVTETEAVENTETEPVENTETEAVEEEKAVDPCAELKKANEDLTKQVSDLKNAYAKAYADTENMKKRLEKDFESRSKYQMASFAKELLPVLDNCERALAQATSDEAFKKGVEMIYSQLQAALAKEEITEIEALNQPFDGNWHQALMSEHRDGVEPGIVIEVLQKGYKIKDRILRPAMVKISD
ncbi:MAG: nucleotide exchange factor GrpE [Bulleidia sp.]